jgi:ubiquinone/menaquinone biosynthesis C-methylase UbiE
MSEQDLSEQNAYVIDAESSAEMARLLQQDRILSKQMGGLLSEQTDPTKFRRVLDIACGPGGWALDMAFTLPEAHVYGVDISQRMIEYARAQAQVQGLENASFRNMDVTKCLDFEANCFDLVNARAIVGFMSPNKWPKLIAECKRVLHPGGILRFTESDIWGVTNSLAYERLEGFALQALFKAGQSFSPDGKTVGITPMMRRLLLDGGFKDVQNKAHVHEFSAGTEAYNGYYHDCMAFFPLIKPFLLRMEMTTEAEFDELYQQMLTDMRSDDFCGNSFFLTVWGVKP